MSISISIPTPGAPTNLCFLLHMHQPLYVDPLTGRAEMPWVRLHGGRGYLDVARLLEEHEHVHMTVNFVPSLCAQLEAIGAGQLDTYAEVALRPTWDPDDRLFLVQRFFSVHWRRCVDSRPRYKELLDKRGREVPAGEMGQRAALFTDAELRDLTVLFHLAWLGFAVREGDQALAELERKGRGYDRSDLGLVLERGRAACARVLPLYRRLAERGQVELTATPYYHPIVPLVIDTDAARRAQPEMALPSRFRYADDARLHIARARAAHERTFGRALEGMWPSEGSVSPEAVAAYGAEGVRWLATDEGNLWRSLAMDPRQAVARAEGRAALYRPWRHAGVDLVFRDRDLSDRIGFSYSHMETREAVADLIERSREAGRIGREARPGETPMVVVALDGENPWEAYPGDGEPFLRALFAALGEARDLRPRAVGEHLRAHPARGDLGELHSGSWIDSDFHIWIGDPVKNRAWDLLGRTRRRLEAAMNSAEAIASTGARPSTEALEAAREHVLAAEGSDWFWWFGEPFHTAEKPLFDRLFRSHLAAVWRALGEQPPDELAQPVAGVLEEGGAHKLRPPRNYIRPRVDGRSGSYFEWLEAGRYELPRGAAMASTPVVTTMHFGFDHANLYLRLDPASGMQARLGRAQVRLVTRVDGCETRLVAMAGEPSLRAAGEAEAVGHVACIDILELSVPLDRIGAAPGRHVELSLQLIEGGVQIERVPPEGGLPLVVPDEHFAADHWSV